ncbi:thioredoxin family protein [Anaeroselena agilis]|uniref:Thioredoxin family protein n=1 Tax=Anaeroselena agilis TaxID=3063788 RepID=A0ABU3NU31_9FIRM|nr:thioredoxin family protein [Selenomonadales bacterium 4137-cl]
MIQFSTRKRMAITVVIGLVMVFTFWVVDNGNKAQGMEQFEQVLHNGQPTVLDLGSGTCVPCKMMKPILDELGQEYENRVNVVVLEIGDYQYLARQYRIRVIPTQIFFDKDGNEYWRHEGFLPKEVIKTKLRELGID